jgi:uncharacterized membrane protein
METLHFISNGEDPIPSFLGIHLYVCGFIFFIYFIVVVYNIYFYILKKKKKIYIYFYSHLLLRLL